MELFHRGSKTLMPVGALVRLVGSHAKWVTVVVAVLISGALLGFGGSPAPSDNSGANLPDSAESSQVQDLQKQLPSGDNPPAVVVFTPDSGSFSDADIAAIKDLGPDLVADGTKTPPPEVSENGNAAILLVPLTPDLSESQQAKSIDDLRATLDDQPPDGLTAEVTGAPAFQADLGDVFEGADITLLAATAAVVALLLLITYRSPWLWLVPLTVIAVGDQVAAKVVAILSRTIDLQVDGSTTGITSVLVFGAGTNYALLLIARYREELRKTEDRHEAMRRALRSAAPAVFASSGTVILALLVLGTFATSPFSAAIGYAGAVGIAIAVAYALLVLPAAMVLFGRGLFWPFRPELGVEDPTHHGFWFKVGSAVVRRPVAVAVSSVVILGVLASGLVGLRVGLSQTEQFRDQPESVVGQEQIEENFAAGTSQPATIITDTADADAVTKAARSVDGVARVSESESDDSLTQLNAVLTADPGSEESFATVESLREAVHAVPDADAKVGGSEARDLDSRDAAEHDRLVIIPMILAIVLVILLLVLRSVVAAALLVLTVVASYAAAMGAGWFAFDHWFGFPAMDLSTPLLAFLFLVALGVDYNIFLTTRAREETGHASAQDGIVKALAATGGVITSAGILLAAVFTVLGVLPLLTLTQLGIIVGFGVLLDTLLVRSVLVPSLVCILGRRFWWPSHLGRG